MYLNFRSLIFDLQEWLRLRVKPEATLEQIYDILARGSLSPDYIIGSGYGPLPGGRSFTAQQLGQFPDLTIQRGLTQSNRAQIRLNPGTTSFIILHTFDSQMTAKQVYQEMHFLGYNKPYLVWRGRGIREDGPFPFSEIGSETVHILERGVKYLRVRPGNEAQVLDLPVVETVGRLYDYIRESIGKDYTGYIIQGLEGEMLTDSMIIKDNIPPSLILPLIKPSVQLPRSEPEGVITLNIRTVDPQLPQWMSIQVPPGAGLEEIETELKRQGAPAVISVVATGVNWTLAITAADLVQLPDLQLITNRGAQLILTSATVPRLSLPLPPRFTAEDVYATLERMGFVQPAVFYQDQPILRGPEPFPATQAPYATVVEQGPPTLWLRPGNQAKLVKLDPRRYPSFEAILELLASQTSFPHPAIYARGGQVSPDQDPLKFSSQILGLVNQEMSAEAIKLLEREASAKRSHVVRLIEELNAANYELEQSLAALRAARAGAASRAASSSQGY